MFTTAGYPDLFLWIKVKVTENNCLATLYPHVYNLSPFKNEIFLVNNIEKFSSYLIGNTMLLRYKYKLFKAA
jgi:hypothetical protein